MILSYPNLHIIGEHVIPDQKEEFAIYKYTKYNQDFFYYYLYFILYIIVGWQFCEGIIHIRVSGGAEGMGHAAIWAKF